MIKNKVSAIIEEEHFEVINTLQTNNLYRNGKIILSANGMAGLKDSQLSWEEKMDEIDHGEFWNGKMYKYIFYKNGKKFILCVYWDVNFKDPRTWLGVRMQMHLNGRYISGKKFKIKETYDLTNDLTEEDTIRHAQEYVSKNKSDEVLFKVVRKVKDD